MNSSAPLSPEFLDLVERLWEDELSGDEWLRLQKFVAADENACWHYLYHAHLHGTLHWNRAVSGSAAGGSARPAPEVLSGVSADFLSAEGIAGSATAPALFHRQDSEKRRRVPFFSRHVVPIVGSVLVLIMFIVSLFMWLPGDYSVASLEVKTPAPSLRLVAQISDTCDAQWSPESRPPVGREYLSEGRWLRLEGGFVQLFYYRGTQILLEGPTDFCVDSDRAGIVDRGKLYLRSKPKSDYEFVLNAYNLHVAERGAEFGLDVSEFGPAELHVFQGEVRATIDGAKGDPVRSFALHAGESLAYNRKTQQLTRGTADEKRFVQRLPSVDDIPFGSTFAEAIRALRPLVYYPMESSPEDPLAVVDCGPRRRHGRLYLRQPAAQPWRGGKSGEAVYLRGEKVRDHILIPDYPQSTSQQLTVLAWVYAESANARGQWNMVTANWGQGKTGQFHLGIVNHNRRTYLGGVVSRSDGLRLAIRDPEPFPLNQWQFIALVVDGETMRLYRNGLEVASGKADGLLFPSAIKGLGIGCKPNNTTTSPAPDFPGYWHGAIDELTIFGRALPPKVIQKLYGKSTP